MAVNTPPPLPPRLPTRVLPHRSIWSLRLPPERLAVGVTLAVVLSALVLLAAPAVQLLWGRAILFWLQALALPGTFTPATEGGRWLALEAPGIDLPLPAPAWWVLALHAVVVVAAWVLSPRLPDAARPATFLIRLAALIHGTAVLFFAFWARHFLHSVDGHVGNLVQQCWLLMVALPWLHLCTYYLMPFTLWQHAGLTLLSLAWLAVLAPLLAATHAALLVLLGLVAMPLLHLLFGVAVPVIGLVSLYGWAMSWRDPAEAAQEQVP